MGDYFTYVTHNARVKKIGCHLYTWIDGDTGERLTPRRMNPLVLWYANIIAVRDSPSLDPRTVDRWTLAFREARRMVIAEPYLAIKVCCHHYGFENETALYKSIV